MGGSNRGSGKGGKRTWIDDAWRRNLESCDHCKATFCDPCRTPRGKTRKPHRGRFERPSRSALAVAMSAGLA